MILDSQWKLTIRRTTTDWRILPRGGAGIQALNLSLDSASIWSSADGRKDWTDSIDEALLHGAGGVVDGSLDDVVGVGVAKETLEFGGGGEHFVDEHVAAFLLSAAKALLDDVRGEFLARELADFALEHVNQWLGEDWLIEVEDILHHIVAEWVLNQHKCGVGDLTDQPGLLIARGVVDTTLKNAAAMTVCADVDAVTSNRIEDELRVEGGKLVQAFLDNVVTIQILDQLHNLITQSLDNDLHLLWCRDELNHLLECASSVLVQGDADKVVGGVADQDGALLVVAELEKLLAEVVAERIGHELDDVHVGLLPDEVDGLFVAALELLLEETASVLVLAECVDLALKGLKADVGEAVHGYKAVSKCQRT